MASGLISREKSNGFGLFSRLALFSAARPGQKKDSGVVAEILFLLVGAEGFEPPTSSSQNWRATRLRHAPSELRGFPLAALLRVVQTLAY